MKGMDQELLLQERGERGSTRRHLLFQCLGLLLGGFALTGVTLAGESLPLAPCLVAVQPFGLRALAAALGTAAGCLLRSGAVDCVENLALTVLLFSAVAVFHGTPLTEQGWFWPVLSGSVCGLLGLISLFGVGGAPLVWLLRCAVAVGAPLLLQEAAQRRPLAGHLTLAAMAAGLAGPEHAPAQGFLFVLTLTGGLLLLQLRQNHALPVQQPEEENRLEAAAGVLELLRRQLPAQERPAAAEAESVYDGAAEQVCRCCARYHRCWDHRGEETFQALSQAARTIIVRGVAQREDFPQSFQNQCCHLDGFVMAVNQELEGMLFRRRYRMELCESRAVLAQEFSLVADFLRQAAQERERSSSSSSYLPIVGSCCVGKGGSRITGDCGACFTGKGQDYYVLLCDGMGTGEEASRCSRETVHLLEELLRAGLCADAALHLLNGVELLRERDRFTTVDLLHLALDSGSAVLYKWGSAHSYWRSRQEVRKIGTASPPPGVGVGADYAPERYELSMTDGELLVLASDGAAEAEAVVSSYLGTSVHELAALLVADPMAEDDASAVVIALRKR